MNTNTIQETVTTNSKRREFANGKTSRRGVKFGKRYRHTGIQFGAGKGDTSLASAVFYGDKARIIGYLKWDDRNKCFSANQKLRRFCKLNHIDIQPIKGESETMEFTGTGEAITKLVHSDYLRKWEHSHSASVPSIFDRPRQSRLTADAQAKLGAASADGYRITYVPGHNKAPKELIKRRMAEQKKRYRELNKVNPIIREIVKFMACMLHKAENEEQTKYCGEYVYNNIVKINDIPADKLPPSITPEFLSSVVRLSADSADLPGFRRDLNAIIQWEANNLNARNVTELCLIRSAINSPEFYVNEMMRVDGKYSIPLPESKPAEKVSEEEMKELAYDNPFGDVKPPKLDSPDMSVMDIPARVVRYWKRPDGTIAER